MKKLILGMVAAIGLAGAAQAASYSIDVTAQPFRVPGEAGLQTRAFVMSPSGPQNYEGSTSSFDLTNVGDTATADLFGMVHYDAPINADDLLHKAMSVTFDFGAYGTRKILGESFAVFASGGDPDHAEVDFLAPISFNIGGGLRILVELADTHFGTFNDIFTNGRPGFGNVTATYTLAAVPLPAALPMGMGALGLMAFVARRRKSKSV